MLIDEIVDRKSKNGVSLLSVAPKADGTIPQSQIAGLKEMGKWMAVNKEALYASTPAPFANIGMDTWRSGTMRFTAKDSYIYAIELGNEVLEMEDADKYTDSDPPKVPYIIPGVMPVKNTEIQMLGSDKNHSWHMDGNNLIIEELPEPLPCEYAWSFKIQVVTKRIRLPKYGVRRAGGRQMLF
jgi:alpha-L-fucosidase